MINHRRPGLPQRAGARIAPTNPSSPGVNSTTMAIASHLMLLMATRFPIRFGIRAVSQATHSQRDHESNI
jgi:hypothetical protein